MEIAVKETQRIRLRPEWAKVMKDETSDGVTPFPPGFTAFRAQDYPKIFLMDGAVYGVRRDTLFAREGKTAAHRWIQGTGELHRSSVSAGSAGPLQPL